MNIIKKIKTFLISDEIYVKKKFKKKLGYELDLKNPKTLNEKIQWLKLYGMTHLHTKCADKYAVREYIKEKIGEEYLIPLLYHTKNPKDITIENLPDQACVIKTNHDSGEPYYLVKDKTKLDYPKIQKELKQKLSRNFYTKTRERQYKDIEPRIIVEKMIIDYEENPPKEYKFLCIHGKIELIWIISNKHTENKKIDALNNKWETLNENDVLFTTKPKQSKELVTIAKILSKDFSLVRVDLYIAKDKIYFGELTFTTSSGFDKANGKQFDDLNLGEKLKLY